MLVGDMEKPQTADDKNQPVLRFFYRRLCNVLIPNSINRGSVFIMVTCSSYQRADLLKQMSTVQMDVLIIGGGITGAGIALDATTRGLTTRLVEMQDFASETSSRSTN